MLIERAGMAALGRNPPKPFFVLDVSRRERALACRIHERGPLIDNNDNNSKMNNSNVFSVTVELWDRAASHRGAPLLKTMTFLTLKVN